MNKNNILPGFRICAIYIFIYIFIIVILPIFILFVELSHITWEDYIKTLSDSRTFAALKTSLFCSFVASLTNIFLASLIGWVLARYEFYGRNFIDMMIDIPYILPSAVSGIALTCLYANDGLMGKFLGKFHIKATYNHLGIIIALIFTNLPFIVRIMQNSINNLSKTTEETAKILGASDFQIFTKIILPNLMASIYSGFIMCFSRSLGEYGAIIFISGNIPYLSETLSYIITTKLEEYDYQSALIIASFILIISFLLLFLANLTQSKSLVNITKR